MSFVIDVAGVFSSILITIMFVPQVVHVYQKNDTRAINYTFLFLNLLASATGLVYSIYYSVIPMLVSNTSAGLFSISLISMKYLNGLKDKSIHEDIPAPMV